MAPACNKQMNVATLCMDILILYWVRGRSRHF